MDKERQDPELPADGDDSVDSHLARWQGKAPFDARVEAIITRIQLLTKHVGQAKDRALSEVGLQEFEFATLHQLGARGPLGRATPSELATELMLSPAGMTGRLDTLEQSGLVRRVRSSQDRRRVDVELTETGRDRWLAAMELRAQAENSLLVPLDEPEQDALNALLKRMLLQAESDSRLR